MEPDRPMEHSTQTTTEDKDYFDSLKKNWKNLDPAKIDDSLYYQDYYVGSDSAEPEWFRAAVFTLDLNKEDFEDFIKQLKEVGYCRVWMGIRESKNGDNKSLCFFEPFLELFNNDEKSSDSKRFKLKIVNHIELMRNKSADLDPHLKDPHLIKRVRDFVLPSDMIPYKFALSMKTNWLTASPAEMADHFKAIDHVTTPNGKLPVLQYVRYYTFDVKKNLKKAAGKNACDRIVGLSVGMGLDLNKKATDFPTFSPILIYSIKCKSSVLKEVNPESLYEVYYEELARPCPPTCEEVK